MNWIVTSLLAIGILGVSDLFRKLGAEIKYPVFANFIFQLSSFSTAAILFLMEKKVDNHNNGILYAVIGGILISVFSILSFKALHDGPGVSVVMPALRIGGVSLVAILGIIILREKLTTHTFLGLIFSAIGIYLLFSNK